MGFAALPNQLHRKSVKKGFDFTLMVAGLRVLERGLVGCPQETLAVPSPDQLGLTCPQGKRIVFVVEQKRDWKGAQTGTITLKPYLAVTTEYEHMHPTTSNSTPVYITQ